MEWLSHLFLHPREVLLFFFPMQMDSVKFELQWREEEKPLFGMLPQKIPVQENIPVPARVQGIVAVTSQRIFFLSQKAENVRVPEVLWELYLHDLIEVETKGTFSKELHIEYEHNEEVQHRIFYGPNAEKLESRIIALIQTEKWLREHPKRVQGKFIHCHACGKWADWRDHYCPHCGARFGGPQRGQVLRGST
jgi:hypothetical protein